MDPLTLAMLLSGGVSVLSNMSAARKEDAYQKQLMGQQVRDRRKAAIENALGAKSLGTLNPIKPPDLSTERTLGAIGQLGGMAAGGMSGGRAPSAGPALMGGSAMMDDPSEAIRRRLQQSYNPYGGSNVA